MKILAVYHNHPTGSSYYRQQMPYEHLTQHYPIDFYYTNTIQDFDTNVLKTFDFVLFSREIEHYGVFDNIKYIATQIKSLGVKVIVDIDDYWHLSANHVLKPQYQQFKISEMIIESIKHADIVHTTTKYLADKICPYNNNVHIFANAIYPEIYPQFTPQEILSPNYRIGWIGGACHYEDIILMQDGINLLHHDTNLNGKYKLILGGYNEASEEYKKFERVFTCFGKQKESYDRINATDVYRYAYGYNMLDAVLIPLNDNTFNNCKSELKLIEAGFMNKAAIVSNVKPYSDLIVHGENALVVNNRRDWYKHMRTLINEPTYGRYLADNLTELITKNYHISVINEHRYKHLSQSIAGNPTLRPQAPQQVSAS